MKAVSILLFRCKLGTYSFESNSCRMEMGRVIMYSIIIVDDEAEVREGIRGRMNWAEIGYKCIGDYENGIEALDAIERLKPDVVLTDINMPFIDGLELTRQVARRFPHIKMLILTGYDDFEYAQQAVKLKVQDFILKPITSQELAGVLTKMKLQLDEERSKYKDLQRLQQLLQESFPLIKERFLERLVTTVLPATEYRQKLDYYQLRLQSGFYVVMTIDVDQLDTKYSMEDREILHFACFNIAQEMASARAHTVAFRNRENQCVLICGDTESALLLESAQQLAEEIRFSLDYYLKVMASIGIGTLAEKLEELPSSYSSSLAALDYRLMLGSNRILHIGDIEFQPASQEHSIQEYEHHIIRMIKTGTKQEVEEGVAALIASLKASNMKISHCYLMVQRCIVSIITTLEELGCNVDDVFGAEVNPIIKVYDYKTLDEIEEWLKQGCSIAIQKLLDSRSHYRLQQMKKAESYIEQHYMNPDLSIKEVCREVHMSSSYFSSLFKQSTSRSFVEYLTQYRMSKARELLKFNDMKTFEIASLVGYVDPHYFSVIFKKYTGETPTEYRQRK